MSKSRNKLILIIFLTFFLFSITACAFRDQPSGESDYKITPRLTPIKMPFEIQKDEETGKDINMYTICYTDDKVIIAADVHNYIAESGSIKAQNVSTKGLYLFEYAGDDGKKIYFDIVEKDNIVYSAVPYNEGVIFAEYRQSSEDTGGEGHLWQWKVKYYDGTQCTEIDSGYCKNKTAAQIFLYNGEPMYVCERYDSKAVTLSINSIDNLKPYIIAELADWEKADGAVDVNENGFFVRAYYEAIENSMAIVGENYEILMQKEMGKQISSAALASDHIVYLKETESGKIQIKSLSLNGAEEKSIDETVSWNKITGSSGEYCLMTDDAYNPYYLDTETGIAGELLLTCEKNSETKEKNFYPAGKDRFILETGKKDYYVLEIDQQ